MKKIALIPLVIGLLFLGKTMFAQDNDNSSKLFHFGLKAVPTLSWFGEVEKKFSNEGSKFGFGYGLITEFGFSKNYAFSTGLEIINAGGTLNFPESPIDSTFFPVPNEDITLNRTDTFLLQKRTYRLRYVSLPLLLKLKTKPIGAMTYFGQFGFDISVLWKAKADDDGSLLGSQTTTNPDVDITNDAEFIRLALNVGLGAEYNLSGSTSLVFSVNYNNGFTNALETPSERLLNRNRTPLLQKAVFNYVGLTVGVLF